MGAPWIFVFMTWFAAMPFVALGAGLVNGLYDLLYALIGWTGLVPFWEGLF